MWEHSVGESDEWYTPPEVFDALGVTFDLDPCSPGEGKCHVPTKKTLTKVDDGLIQPWHGFVFMNPPFGGRNGHLPWLRRFVMHRNGIAIVRAYTSAAWFHDYVPRMDGVLFPKGKTKFIRPDGSVGSAPGHGVALLALGARAKHALRTCGLGIYFQP